MPSYTRTSVLTMLAWFGAASETRLLFWAVKVISAPIMCYVVSILLLRRLLVNPCAVSNKGAMSAKVLWLDLSATLHKARTP